MFDLKNLFEKFDKLGYNQREVTDALYDYFDITLETTSEKIQEIQY